MISPQERQDLWRAADAVPTEAHEGIDWVCEFPPHAGACDGPISSYLETASPGLILRLLKQNACLRRLLYRAYNWTDPEALKEHAPELIREIEEQLHEDSGSDPARGEGEAE